MFQKIKCKIAVLTFFFISVAFSAQNFNVTPSAFAEEIPFRLNYAPAYYNFGATLVHFLAELNQNKFSQKDLHDLILWEKKSGPFSFLKPILDRAQLINEISNQDLFYTNCAQSSPAGVNEPQASSKEKFTGSLDRYCRYLFLNRLSRLSSGINFSTRDLPANFTS